MDIKCIAYTALFILFINLILMGNAYAQDNDEVTSSELINKASEYDGKQVIYCGEVIGDIMKRGDYAWINVSDGSNAIGVYLPANQISQIRFTGDYKHKGDIIKVRGTFYRACAQHGGDLDIHADGITVLQEGFRIEHAISKKRVLATVVLAAIALLLLYAARRHSN